MRTLDLGEAAAFLKLHPQTVRRLARTGVLPAAKPGRRWCFLEDDLVRYLRSLYAPERQVPQGVHRENLLWHSTNAAASGGLDLRPPTAEKYGDLLGLTKGERRKSSTTGSKRRAGGGRSWGNNRAESGRKLSNDG